MEQDRFDELAKKVFDGSSRRRVIGGALASVVGAGVAAVTGASAKGKKAKKAKKGKAKGEFTCTANNANFDTCTNVGCGVDQDCFDVGCFGACVGGLCTAPGNTTGACAPGSCCASTTSVSPSCVDVITQVTSGEGGFCGDLNGEGVCRRCPAGTRCSQDPNTFEIRCVCNTATCNGCCIDNGVTGDDDQCIANGSGAPVSSPNPNFDNQFVCGTGGGQCESCGSEFANGCCSARGNCTIGTSNLNCGSGGQLCQTCQNDSSCGIDQACTGGTTAPPPTTTPAPTTPPPAVCPQKTCGSGATRVCCNNKQRCPKAGSTTCRKKKHKKHHKKH